MPNTSTCGEQPFHGDLAQKDFRLAGSLLVQGFRAGAFKFEPVARLYFALPRSNRLPVSPIVSHHVSQANFFLTRRLLAHLETLPDFYTFKNLLKYVYYLTMFSGFTIKGLMSNTDPT